MKQKYIKVVVLTAYLLVGIMAGFAIAVFTYDNADLTNCQEAYEECRQKYNEECLYNPLGGVNDGLEQLYANND